MMRSQCFARLCRATLSGVLLIAVTGLAAALAPAQTQPPLPTPQGTMDSHAHGYTPLPVFTAGADNIAVRSEDVPTESKAEEVDCARQLRNVEKRRGRIGRPGQGTPRGTGQAQRQWSFPRSDEPHRQNCKVGKENPGRNKGILKGLSLIAIQLSGLDLKTWVSHAGGGMPRCYGSQRVAIKLGACLHRMAAPSPYWATWKMAMCGCWKDSEETGQSAMVLELAAHE